MERYIPKKVPQPEKPTRQVNNRPDRPIIIRHKLPEAAVRVEQDTKPYQISTGYEVSIERHLPWSLEPDEIPEERVKPLKIITPLMPEPLTPPTVVSINGKPRSIGGGTSLEAIRRAKKKASRRP